MGPRGTLVSHVKHSKDWKYQCKPAPILFVEVYEFHLRSTNLVSYGIHIDDKFTVPVPAPASTHLDVASGFWHQVFYHQTLMRFWSDESATVHMQGTWICEFRPICTKKIGSAGELPWNEVPKDLVFPQASLSDSLCSFTRASRRLKSVAILLFVQPLFKVLTNKLSISAWIFF